MSKRNNVAFIKPKEPSFLAKLKAEAGYKEGPTIDTKREDLPSFHSDSDGSDNEGEQPTVVVLKDGDLTAEEAEKIQAKLDKEEAEAPADLSQPIKFRKPVKAETESTTDEPPRKMKKKPLTNSKLLSFDQDEEEED